MNQENLGGCQTSVQLPRRQSHKKAWADNIIEIVKITGNPELE